MATEYTHSIPTPPFSPQNLRMPDENTENPLKSTVNILDTLVAFYQSERMWIYRTRASLDDAFPTPPIAGDRSFLNSDTPSSGVDTGYDMNGQPIPGSSAQNQPTTRWNRRKKGFKLRINGIRNKRVFSTQPVGEHQEEPERLPPREQILEMFEKMMEARMESCQRVNKLIRDANRANLNLQ